MTDKNVCPTDQDENGCPTDQDKNVCPTKVQAHSCPLLEYGRGSQAMSRTTPPPVPLPSAAMKRVPALRGTSPSRRCHPRFQSDAPAPDWPCAAVLRQASCH